MSASTKVPDDKSLGTSIATVGKRFIGRRRGLIAVGAMGVVAGLALSWNWLVAVGVAPILLTLAPCAAMCALGICMHKQIGQGKPTDQKSSAPRGSVELDCGSRNRP